MAPTRRNIFTAPSNGSPYVASQSQRSPSVRRNGTDSPRRSSASFVSEELKSKQLPDNEQLVNTKEFLITGTENGKYLACGEKVRVYPELNEFKIRILNMDFKFQSVLRNYVEFSKASFDELVCHASEIGRIFDENLPHRREVFQHMGLSVSIGPVPSTNGNTIELRSNNCFSQMKILTFCNMIQCKDQVDREYFEFENKSKRDIKICKSILNMFAYLSNGEKPNTAGVVEPLQQSSLRKRVAIVNTYNNLLKQVGNAVDKEPDLENN